MQELPSEHEMIKVSKRLFACSQTRHEWLVKYSMKSKLLCPHPTVLLNPVLNTESI